MPGLGVCSMRAFHVTYTNGDSYITSANGTLEEFTAYITQSYHVEENQVTGKETKLYVATVEEVTEPGQSPIQSLTCCCCSASTRGRQWHNRDTGFGLCPKCARWIATRETPEAMQENYGTPEVNYFTKEL